MSALIFPSKRRVGHASQYIGMIGPELCLASLYYMQKQVLGLLPPASVQEDYSKY